MSQGEPEELRKLQTPPSERHKLGSVVPLVRLQIQQHCPQDKDRAAMVKNGNLAL